MNCGECEGYGGRGDLRKEKEKLVDWVAEPFWRGRFSFWGGEIGGERRRISG